jgi:hypothetical protein
MADTEFENLAVFYRTLTTEQLQTYRAALILDRDQARQSRGKRGSHTVEFCVSRIELLERVLGERGVVVDRT